MAVQWNDESLALVRRLFEQGASAHQIALQIPGATRNAVIGKLNRMQLRRGDQATLPPRGRPATRPPRKPGPRRMIKPPTPYVEPPMPVLSDDCPPFHSRARMDLEDGMCKWPVYVEQDVQMYCGAITGGPRQPYCAHHDRASHQKEPRRTFVPYKRRSITGGYA